VKLLIYATQNYCIQPEEKVVQTGPETKIWYFGPEISPGPRQKRVQKIKDLLPSLKNYLILTIFQNNCLLSFFIQILKRKKNQEIIFPSQYIYKLREMDIFQYNISTNFFP